MLDLSVPAIMGAALLDSINPCAIAVIIFLLTYLMAVGSKKLMLKVGIVYIAVVYISYFLAGVGLIGIISTVNISNYITKAAGVILILAALFNIKDFFWYGKGLTLEIPQSKRAKMHELIKKSSVPAAIVLGVFVSFFELPCSGAFYLAALSLLAKYETFWNGVGYLLIYNFIFVLPLIVILMLAYYGFSSEAMNKFREEKRKWLKLSMGVGMLVLGVLILIGVI